MVVLTALLDLIKEFLYLCYQLSGSLPVFILIWRMLISVLFKTGGFNNEILFAYGLLHEPVYFDDITWLALGIVFIVSLIIIVKIGERR